MANWRDRVRSLRDEALVLYVVHRDPRVPWYARVYVALVLAYLFSPIDLIPDVIPVLGYLDELLLMPVFVVIARRLIPPAVVAESRERIAIERLGSRPIVRAGAWIIVLVWAAVGVTALWALSRAFGG